MESIHEILILKPYGVLGKQKLSTDGNKVIEKGDDPANMDSCVIVDCGEFWIFKCIYSHHPQKINILIHIIVLPSLNKQSILITSSLQMALILPEECLAIYTDGWVLILGNASQTM